MVSSNYPIKSFLKVWILVFLLRTIGLLKYANIEFNTILAISLFVFLLIFSFILGNNSILESKSLIIRKYDVNSSNNVLILARFSIFFSLMCFICLFIKMGNLSSNYSVNLDLKGLSTLRNAQMTDATFESGSSIFGIISGILFGFPVLCVVLGLYYNQIVSKKLSIILNVIFLLGLFLSFMTGGRLTAFTFVLVYFFAKNIIPSYGEKNKSNNKSKLLYAVLVIVILWVFSRMFSDRRGEAGLEEVLYVLPLCEPSNLTKFLLLHFPSYGDAIGIMGYFEFYVTHGLNQLDVLLNSPYPIHAPYFGAYQFSAFALFFKKLGFDIISNDIMSLEIPVSGYYFTEIGPMYLDFGIWGSIVLLLIYGYSYGKNWKKFINKPTLFTFYFVLIFLVLSNVSPIISLVGAGYFSGILVSLLFLYIFQLFIPLP